MKIRQLKNPLPQMAIRLDLDAYRLIHGEIREVISPTKIAMIPYHFADFQIVIDMRAGTAACNDWTAPITYAWLHQITAISAKEASAFHFPINHQLDQLMAANADGAEYLGNRAALMEEFIAHSGLSRAFAEFAENAAILDEYS